jgi:hypothetical protein
MSSIMSLGGIAVLMVGLELGFLQAMAALRIDL